MPQVSGNLKSFEDLISHLEKNKKALMAYSLKNDLSVEEFADGFMKITVSDRLQPDLIMSLHKILEEISGKAWTIDISRGALGETVADKEKAKDEENKRNVSEIPLVKAILDEFKGAKIDIATRKILQNEVEKDIEADFFSEEV